MTAEEISSKAEAFLEKCTKNPDVVCYRNKADRYDRADVVRVMCHFAENLLAEKTGVEHEI